MTSFTAKPLDAHRTLSEILSAARQEKHLKIEKIEKDLKINKKYLQALEAGDYQKLPGKIYTRSYIRRYAHYLGLKRSVVEPILEEELKIFDQISATDQPVAEETPFIIITPQRVKYAFLGLATLALLLYLGWGINKIFSPPRLVITAPAADLLTSDDSVTIEGRTDPEVEVVINGQTATVDNQGVFRQPLNLAIGLNTIDITAKKKWSKANQQTLQIISQSQPEIIEGSPPQ